jgi:hypothetical protein
MKGEATAVLLVHPSISFFSLLKRKGIKKCLEQNVGTSALRSARKY